MDVNYGLCRALAWQMSWIGQSLSKDMQRNWIAKIHTGANVTFKSEKTDKEFTVFTTRPDTLFGATFHSLGSEHDLVDAIHKSEQV